MSLSSFSSNSTFKDSIDMMDFGVDHALNQGLSNGSSNYSKSPGMYDSESMSKFVDSDGFMGWGRGSMGLRADTRTGEVAGRRGSAKESNPNPGLSHVVDKEGFLGLGKTSSSCSTDSTASDDSAEDQGEEREPSAKGEDADRIDRLKGSTWSTLRVSSDGTTR